MKFSKVAALCKKRKRIHVYNDPKSEAQWLGDGIGIYLLEGMPQITTDECLRLFDVPEDKHSSYFCLHNEV